MKSFMYYLSEIVSIVLLFTLIVLFTGTPDISDAIMYKIKNSAHCECNQSK